MTLRSLIRAPAERGEGADERQNEVLNSAHLTVGALLLSRFGKSFANLQPTEVSNNSSARKLTETRQNAEENPSYWFGVASDSPGG